MGLFDHIKGKFFCPFCGDKLEYFQTKNLESILDSYAFHLPVEASFPSVEMHILCPSCKNWVSLNIPKSNLTLKNLARKKGAIS